MQATLYKCQMNKKAGSKVKIFFFIFYFSPASFEWEDWENIFHPLPIVDFETENWGRNFFSEGSDLKHTFQIARQVLPSNP